MPNSPVYASYQNSILRSYINPGNIMKEWFAYYLRHSNIVPLLNPSIGLTHVIQFDFVGNVSNMETSDVDEGLGICKYCVAIVCKLKQVLCPIREISHYVTADRYPFMRIRNKAMWCKLCKRTPMFRCLSINDCMLEYGAGPHKCMCPNNDCVWCDSGVLKMWTIYDSPERIISFRRALNREYPYTLHARRRLEFVSTNIF